MPELVEPLVGTADFELLSQGAEAVRKQSCQTTNIVFLVLASFCYLCSESGREAFWAK